MNSDPSWAIAIQTTGRSPPFVARWQPGELLQLAPKAWNGRKNLAKPDDLRVEYHGELMVKPSEMVVEPWEMVV